MRIDVAGHQAFVGTGSAAFSNEQPCVVFLHGAGMDHSVWVMPSRYFARHGFAVAAPDFPAHGRSAGEPLPSIVAMADWVASLLDALGVKRAAVVGHSMGSLVAQAFARFHPERCRALALLGTSAPMPVTERLLGAAEDNHHAAIDMANTWSHSRFAQIGGSEVPGMWMTVGGERLLERAADNVFFTDLNACNNFANGAELAAEVQCPSLVILGAQDMMTAPVNSYRVAEAIPDCRTVELDHCGHSMLSERPDAVLNALRSLILTP
jgi:pimeloyl-ACP methyl ester carboxylesterase